MDARYVQRGDAIDYTPEAAVNAGDIVILGKLVGIAKLDIAAGELGALAVTGVYEIAKGGTAFAAGSLVAWNPTTRQAVAGGTSGATNIGHCVALASATEPTVFVRLSQGL